MGQACQYGADNSIIIDKNKLISPMVVTITDNRPASKNKRNTHTCTHARPLALTKTHKQSTETERERERERETERKKDKVTHIHR